MIVAEFDPFCSETLQNYKEEVNYYDNCLRRKNCSISNYDRPQPMYIIYAK